MGTRNFRNISLILKTKFNKIDTLINPKFQIFIRRASVSTSYKLSEVGVFKPVQIEGNYETGQLFLHKIFGYRGVVLFPWVARVFDHSDVTPPTRSHDKERSTKYNKANDVKPKTQNYYQALIDNRDAPYIRAHFESVTFLLNQENNRSLYSIPGLDYVSHEDILPYTSTEKLPIAHELFDKFLLQDPESSYIARETLRAWQGRHHLWLELSEVYISEITNNIRLTVIPFYMGSKEQNSQKTYWWRYSIRFENLGNEPVTIRERNWRIFSLSGTLETFRGNGVVGVEPCLTKENPVFQYSSFVSLGAPSGHMWGTFKLLREDGSAFEVKVPTFNLASKEEN